MEVEGDWDGEVFTVYEDLAWKVSLHLEVTDGKVTGTGTLVPPAAEAEGPSGQPIQVEGQLDAPAHLQQRRALLRVQRPGWSDILALAIDDTDGATLKMAGTGQLCNCSTASFAQLLLAARAETEGRRVQARTVPDEESAVYL
jgi:hypothetical protein